MRELATMILFSNLKVLTKNLEQKMYFYFFHFFRLDQDALIGLYFMLKTYNPGLNIEKRTERRRFKCQYSTQHSSR